MNTRLPDLLHDLASEMPTETRTPVHRTLRRARTRRAAMVALSSATVVAVVFGTWAGLRVLSSADPNERPIVPGTDAPTPPPSPSGFSGIWPETTADALAEVQAQVDDGHHPLRLDASQTAAMLATNLFGWSDESVQVTMSANADGFATVGLRNSDHDEIPWMSVDLAQLGRTGAGGIWSVVHVFSPLFRSAGTSVGPDSSIEVHGTVSLTHDDDRVRYELLSGSVPVPEQRGFLTVDGDSFEATFTPETFPVVLWLHIVDSTGSTLGASATPPFVPIPSVDVPTPTPTEGPDFTDLPPDVAVTAQRIYDAILAGDVDALAPLLDPNTFAYNFDDGSNPIPGWREDPSDLDLAAAILQLPAAEPREIEGYGTFYLWPYLIDSDFSNLSDQERADLHFLGYSDEEIQLMIDGGYGYQGARLGIDAEGLWRNFTTVGE